VSAQAARLQYSYEKVPVSQTAKLTLVEGAADGSDDDLNKSKAAKRKKDWSTLAVDAGDTDAVDDWAAQG
jgi:hypothetical protein